MALTPEQVEAELERLEPAFRLTADDERRRDAVRTIVDPVTWQQIVSTMIPPILHSFANGELTLEEAADHVDRISIGCFHQARMHLMGTFAYLARRTPPRERKTRPPLYPECVRSGTADLILTLKEASPSERVTPGAPNRSNAYDPSSPLIKKALDILTTIQWFGPAGPPSAHTIERWIQIRRKELGQTLTQGRPRTPR